MYEQNEQNLKTTRATWASKNIKNQTFPKFDSEDVASALTFIMKSLRNIFHVKHIYKVKFKYWIQRFNGVRIYILKFF